MDRVPPHDPVLVRFRHDLDTVFGARIDKVVLYGSRARDDARPDSDYDVAVFLYDMKDRGLVMNQLADIGTDIVYEAGKVIHAMPYAANSYGARTPLMAEIRRDGIEL